MPSDPEHESKECGSDQGKLIGQANIESGEAGPCLTDAAHETALDEPFAARRYAVIRTDIPAMIAALNPGGVM